MRLVALAVAALALSSCRKQVDTRLLGAEVPENAAFTIKVVNQNLQDMVVYILHDGRRDRLGNATAATTTNFEFRLRRLGAGREFALQVDPIGGRQPVRTETYLARDGALVTWTLETDLRRSTVTVFDDEASGLLPDAHEQARRKWAERSGEHDFQVLAMEVRGFAGFFYASPGSDTLVVAIAGPGNADGALAATARVMGVQRGGPFAKRMVVRRVRYSFLELDGWRAAVEDRLLQLAPVTMVDLDEARNAVGVGVAPGAPRIGVDSVMQSAGVPANAYYVMTFARGVPLRARL